MNGMEKEAAYGAVTLRGFRKGDELSASDAVRATLTISSRKVDRLSKKTSDENLQG